MTSSPIEIHYAYPSSPLGGVNGAYYFEIGARRISSCAEKTVIKEALKIGQPVVIAYGPRERADDWRSHGVTHALDAEILPAPVHDATEFHDAGESWEDAYALANCD